MKHILDKSNIFFLIQIKTS